MPSLPSTPIPEHATKLPLILGVIYSGSVVGMMGVHLISPGLPVMQRQLALTDWEISLFISVYLLPSIFFSFVSGLLANRFGSRAILTIALVVFGSVGFIITVTEALPVLLLVRVLQGVAFAAIVPLSITLIGDFVTGREQIKAQGHRLVVMLLAGNMALPVVGGALSVINWHLPFALQMLALPLALAVWFWLPDLRVARKSSLTQIGQLAQFLRDRTAYSLQLSDLLRLFFKFVFLSAVPILLVNAYGLTPVFAGLMLAASALTAAVVASTIGQLVRLVRPSRLIALSMVAMAIGFAGVANLRLEVPLLLASIIFGVGDGIFNVLQNAAITQVSSEDLRTLYIATTGSVRNLGKFLAPTVFGALTLVMSLPAFFMLLAGLACLGLVLVPPFQRLDTRLGGQAQADKPGNE